MASSPLALGSSAPSFQLPEPLTGKTWTLADFADKPALLVMFICNHCPFVVLLKEALTTFANEYIPKGLAIVGISSNSVRTHPQDGPNFMAEDAKKFQYPFPYVYDQTQEVAKAYGAVCTPDLFLFKKQSDEFVLAYHGQFDDARPRNGKPVTGEDLKAAVDALLEGREVDSAQKPCVGCSIKWE